MNEYLNEDYYRQIVDACNNDDKVTCITKYRKTGMTSTMTQIAKDSGVYMVVPTEKKNIYTRRYNLKNVVGAKTKNKIIRFFEGRDIPTINGVRVLLFDQPNPELDFEKIAVAVHAKIIYCDTLFDNNDLF